MSIVVLALSLGTCVALVQSQAPMWSRLLMFFPFLICAMMLVQAFYRTCIGAAAMGVRRTDDGREDIIDRQEKLALRAKSRKIAAISVFSAVCATSLLYFLS